MMRKYPTNSPLRIAPARPKARLGANAPFSMPKRNLMALSSLAIAAMAFAPPIGAPWRLSAPKKRLQEGRFGSAKPAVWHLKTARLARPNGTYRRARPPTMGRRDHLTALPKLFRRAARVFFLMKNIYRCPQPPRPLSTAAQPRGVLTMPNIAGPSGRFTRGKCIFASN